MIPYNVRWKSGFEVESGGNFMNRENKRKQYEKGCCKLMAAETALPVKCAED